MTSSRKLSLGALTALVLAVAVWSSGCQAWKSGPSETIRTLPSLPKAATIITPGDTVSFQGTRITLLETIGEDGDEHARLAFEGKGAPPGEKMVPLDRFVIAGDYLLRLEHRSRNPDPENPLFRLTAEHIPQFLSSPSIEENPDRRTIDEGTVAYFENGLVAVESVSDQEYKDFGDDKADVLLYFDGEEKSVEIEEFHGLAAGNRYALIENVYTGRYPGEGIVEVRVVPRDDAWNEALETDTLTLEPERRSEWAGGEIVAQSADDSEARVLATLFMENANRVAAFTIGEFQRLGRYGLLFEGQDGGEYQFREFVFEEVLWPAKSRLPMAPGQSSDLNGEREEDPIDAPTEQTVSLRTGEHFDFWGSRVELQDIREEDPTQLLDDKGLFVVTYDRVFEEMEIREGTRRTITGKSRWWLIVVEDLRPGLGPQGGEAVIRLQTGTYLGTDRTKP